VTEVTGVSPTSGSVMGGTLLTISGRYFDETDAPIQVKVGGKFMIPPHAIQLGIFLCEFG
jgi:hypothetical protein